MPKASKLKPGAEMNGAIALKVAQLRKAQGLSFDALASRSGLSKGALVAIEQGSANPSIGTLCKLAAALHASLTDLLAQQPSAPSAVRIVSPDQAIHLWHGPKGGRATLLVGTTGPDMLELWEWTMHPGEEFRSKGHGKGCVELLFVKEGALDLEIDSIAHIVAAGHSAVARTDRPHVYRCHGRVPSHFHMAVQEPMPRADRRR